LSGGDDTGGIPNAGGASSTGGHAIEQHEPGREPTGGPAAGPEVAGVPLAELHVHLEATATPALVRRLAARNRVEIPPGTIDGDRYVWSDFLDFLRTFDRAVTVVRTAEDYRDITAEYLAACAAEGAIYVEITVSADHADQAGLPYDDMIAGVAQGIDDARAASGIESRIVVTAVRNFGTERAEWVARTAAAEPHPYVTGFGLAGDEAGFPPAPFARAFEIARDAGLGLTCHAGEWAGRESVRAALELGVTRLGHGVRAVEDPALVRELAERGIVLEVCPTSNVVLGAYPDYAAHPFPMLRDAGVLVTLGSDDPPYWEASIGGEYAVARREWGLDDAALRAITRTALEAAFVPDHLRNALLAQIQQ
jgi:adenosine deaminase